jgi:cell wall assembly regulator SMI1
LRYDARVTEKLVTAVERAKRWMKENGAGVLVDNLSAGASPQELDKAEAELGFALPAQARALWSLHDGQENEMDGFVDALDLFGVWGGVRERERVVRLFVSWLLRERENDPDMWAESQVSDEEADDRWLPFAGRDSDYMLVHARTGRVFRAGKDAPPLHLEAPSLEAFFDTYANDMESGRATVEEGFGACFVARE